jgi:hypothetical protein
VICEGVDSLHADNSQATVRSHASGSPPRFWTKVAFVPKPTCTKCTRAPRRSKPLQRVASIRARRSRTMGSNRGATTPGFSQNGYGIVLLCCESALMDWEGRAGGPGWRAAERRILLHRPLQPPRATVTLRSGTDSLSHCCKSSPSRSRMPRSHRKQILGLATLQALSAQETQSNTG